MGKRGVPIAEPRPLERPLRTFWLPRPPCEPLPGVAAFRHLRHAAGLPVRTPAPSYGLVFGDSPCRAISRSARSQSSRSLQLLASLVAARRLQCPSRATASRNQAFCRLLSCPSCVQPLIHYAAAWRPRDRSLQKGRLCIALRQTSHLAHYQCTIPYHFFPLDLLYCLLRMSGDSRWRRSPGGVALSLGSGRDVCTGQNCAWQLLLRFSR